VLLGVLVHGPFACSAGLCSRRAGAAAGSPEGICYLNAR